MQDMAMFYIEESQHYIDKLVEIPLYDSLFEATEGNPTVVSMEQNNAANGQKAESMLHKAIEAIKSIYNRIKDALVNMWNYLKLKPDEKDAYNAFVKKCKEDPAFANKKITVKDFQAIDKQYDELIREVEAEIEKVKRSDEAMKPTIMKSLENKLRQIGNFADKATRTVVAEQLINRAKYNEGFAQELGFMNDVGVLDLLTKGLDPKDQKKYNKQVQRINSTSRLVRFLAGVRGQKADLHKQAAFEEKKMMQALGKSALKATVKYGNGIKGVKEVGSVGLAIAKNAAGDVWKDKKQLNYLKRQERKQERMEKKAERQEARQEKWRRNHPGPQYSQDDLAAERKKIRKEKIDKIKSRF